MRAAPEGSAHHTQRWHNRRDRCAGARPCPCRFDACAAQGGEARERAKSPPSRSTEKSWPHFRPSAVDFCGSRLAIGAATERGPPPQPTLPAVRHAILELFARLPPQRCPHCQKWICNERRLSKSAKVVLECLPEYYPDPGTTRVSPSRVPFS